MHVFYASRDGQARRIAERIAVRLGDHGIVATPHDLAVSSPSESAIADSAVAILVAAVRYGRHLPPALGFLATYARISSPPPLVLASVNLTARKPGKDTAEGNPYLRKLIARQRLTPALATAFAGRLDYPSYGLFDREIIRLIMRLTGGPTDPATQVEYTSWPAVDAFAAHIAALCNHRSPGRTTGSTLPHGAQQDPGATSVAVGTLIAERPPHRSVRAAFPHTAPTLSV